VSRERVRSVSRAGVLALCLVQFVDVLGVTAATTAIPTIVRAFHADEGAAALIGSAYATAFGGLLVVGARAGDRWGPRRTLLFGVAAFGVVGVAGAASPSIWFVVAARAAQGAAAAISVPSAQRLLLGGADDERRRGAALALWSATGAVAGACGFVVGGLLVQAFGWPAVFWVNSPVAGVLLVSLLRTTRRTDAGADRSVVLGAAGAGLLVTAVSSVVLGAALAERAATRAIGLALFVAGVAVTALLVVQQRRTAAPLLPPGAAGNRNLRVGSGVSFINTATTSSAAVLATLLLQDGLGLSAVQAGFALLPVSLGAVGGAALASRLGLRLPPSRTAALGLTGIALGDLVLAGTPASVLGVVVGGAVLGLGLGIASVPATGIGSTVPPALLGSATGVINTGAQLGTAIGTAALVVLAVSIGGGSGRVVAWVVAALLAAVTAALLARRTAAGADRR
jgi:MFS family permease